MDVSRLLGDRFDKLFDNVIDLAINVYIDNSVKRQRDATMPT